MDTDDVSDFKKALSQSQKETQAAYQIYVGEIRDLIKRKGEVILKNKKLLTDDITALMGGVVIGFDGPIENAKETAMKKLDKDDQKKITDAEKREGNEREKFEKQAESDPTLKSHLPAARKAALLDALNLNAKQRELLEKLTIPWDKLGDVKPGEIIAGGMVSENFRG